MSIKGKTKENESFLLKVLQGMKNNASFYYPYDDNMVVFQKLDGIFVGDHENYSRVKQLVSPEFLHQYFKLKNSTIKS